MIVTTIDAIRRDDGAHAINTTKSTLIDEEDAKLTTEYAFDVVNKKVVWTVDFKADKNDKPRLFSLNLTSGDDNAITVEDFQLNGQKVNENLKDLKDVFERGTAAAPAEESATVVQDESSVVQAETEAPEDAELQKQLGTEEISAYKDSYTYLDAATTDKQDLTITFTTPLAANAKDVAVKFLPRLIEYADGDQAEQNIDGKEVLPLNKNDEPKTYVVVAKASDEQSEEASSSSAKSESSSSSVADSAVTSSETAVEPTKPEDAVANDTADSEAKPKAKPKPAPRLVVADNPVDAHPNILDVNRVQILQQSFTSQLENGNTDRTKFNINVQGLPNNAQPVATGGDTAFANTVPTPTVGTGQTNQVIVRQKYDVRSDKIDAANANGGGGSQETRSEFIRTRYHSQYTLRAPNPGGTAGVPGQSSFLVEFQNAAAITNNVKINVSYNNVGVYYDEHGVTHKMGAILTIKDIVARNATTDGVMQTTWGLSGDRPFIDIPNNLFSGILYSRIQNLNIELRYYSLDGDGNIDQLLNVKKTDSVEDDPKLKSWTTFGSLNNFGTSGNNNGQIAWAQGDTGIQGYRYAETVKKITDAGNADLSAVKSIGSLMRQITQQVSTSQNNAGGAWNKPEYLNTFYSTGHGYYDGLTAYQNSLPGNFGDFLGAVDYDRASVSFQIVGTMNEFFLKSGTGNTWQTISSGYTRPIAPSGPYKTVSNATEPGTTWEVNNKKIQVDYYAETLSSPMYTMSTSATNTPGGWLTNVPSVAAGQYLWARYQRANGGTNYIYTRSKATGVDAQDSPMLTVTAPTAPPGTPTPSWNATKPTVNGNTLLWKRTRIDGTNEYRYEAAVPGKDTFGTRKASDAYYYDNLNIYRGGELLSNTNATPEQGNNTPFFYNIHQPTYATPDDSVAKPHDITMYDLLPAGIMPFQSLGKNGSGTTVALNYTEADTLSEGSTNFANVPDATAIYGDLVKVKSLPQDEQTVAMKNILDAWFGISSTTNTNNSANNDEDRFLVTATGNNAIPNNNTSLARWRTAWGTTSGNIESTNNNTPRLWNNTPKGLGEENDMVAVAYSNNAQGASNQAAQRSIPRIGKVNVGTAAAPNWRYLVVWSISDYEISQLNFTGEAFTFRIPVVAASHDMPNQNTWYDFINDAAVRFDLSDPEAEWHWQGDTPAVLSRYSYNGFGPSGPQTIQLRKTWYDANTFTTFNNRPNQVYYQLTGQLYNTEDIDNTDGTVKPGSPVLNDNFSSRRVSLSFQGNRGNDADVLDPHWQTIVQELPSYPRNADGTEDNSRTIVYKVTEIMNDPTDMSKYRQIDYDDSDDLSTIETGDDLLGTPYDDDAWVNQESYPFVPGAGEPNAGIPIDRRVAITNTPNAEFVNVGVKKIWYDEEGNEIPAAGLSNPNDTERSITVQLTRDGEPYGDPVEIFANKSVTDGKEVPATVLGAWSAEWKNLPRSDPAEKWRQYDYALYEVSVNDGDDSINWTPIYSRFNDESNGYDQRVDISNYQVTLPDSIPLTGRKLWVDDNTSRPASIGVRLYARINGQRVDLEGKPSTAPLTVVQPDMATGLPVLPLNSVTTLDVFPGVDNNWKFTLFNPTGDDYKWPTKIGDNIVNYELEEDNVPGYRLLNQESDLTNINAGDDSAIGQGFRITNQQRYPNSSNVHLNKVDKDSGEQLTDVRFKLHVWHENENAWVEVNAGQTADGLFNYNSLPVGLYRISEETTNAGYQVLKGKIYFNMITSTATANAGDVVLDTRVGHRMFVDLDGADLSATDRGLYTALGGSSAAPGLTFAADNNAATKNTVRQWMQTNPGSTVGSAPAITTGITSQWDGGRITRIHSVQGVSIELENRKPIAPPETGGLGIIVFVLLGLTLSLVGLKYFDARRQRTIK